MNTIVEKSIRSLQDEGVLQFCKRSMRYIKKKVSKSSICEQGQYPAMVDVLFINGCDSSVPHPARYRVTHQREQLMAYNIISDEIYYIDLQMEQVKYAHLFVFFRCPYTDTIGKFIEKAKELNKTVLFDIDDLVVDTKYTDTIKYIQQMTKDEKALYDDGVNRMGHTLRLCEGAITTTERLATELNKYVPEVFINRNTASERMYALSEAATKEKGANEIRIGYFSGSITHNDDFKLVLPVLCNIMKKHAEVKLYIVGELDLPEELEPYKDQIVATPFLDWQKLPQLIASVDINIAPLEQSIFNEAKSENKWVEAALVKVPTIASNVGAFARMIKNNETGVLCDTNEEWSSALEKMITDKLFRKKVAENAYAYCKENCLTLYSGKAISKHLQSKMHPSAIFVLPSTEISGGIMVVLKHASFLQRAGYDVTFLADNPSLSWMEYDGCSFPVLANGKNAVLAYFDKGIATMWTTTPFIETHPRLGKRFYLVQNFEVDFYQPDIALRIQANQSYNLMCDVQYITISKWCQSWLKDKYEKEAKYAPNGMVIDAFKMIERKFEGKIRVLIEGDCAVDYKRVDESFRITNQLDKERYEIWYMSYNEKPKKWYQYDKFLHRVPYEKVPEVYQQCDILLKSSVLESFSYPPIEMMATGGLVVAVANGGNVEYMQDGYNCLFYESSNEKQAIECIEKIVSDKDLRKKLSENGRKTAEKRDWEQLRKNILSLYE